MKLDLERLSILFVDDSPFIRTLVISSLKMIGVGHVSLAKDGGSAIDLIKKVKSDPMRAGIQSIDMVISNWDMSPTDGSMLLRWLRRHKDSPDRFMPFLMLTAYTEQQRVEEARNLGAHEVLAKPFTMKSLGEKIALTINRNRQFVHTRDYFGPDRRRQSGSLSAAERRERTDKSIDVEIVHG